MIAAGIAGLAVWITALALCAFAYASATWASALDGRLVSGLFACGIPFVLGHLVAAALVRMRRGRMGLVRHGLALAALAVAVLGHAHVGPAMTSKVLVEEIPPLFAFVYPLLAFATPPALALGARRVHPADQALALALVVAALEGALFIAEPPVALGVAVCALLLQLARPGAAVGRPVLLIVPLLFALQLAVATASGENLLHAMPALQWILAMTCIAAALGVRKRGPTEWRALLGVTVAAALAIALLGGILLAWIALELGPRPALDTRIVLFRQHPNFLAPFFAVHALVAAGLALSAGRGRIAAAGAAAALVAATLLTDSRTGIGALALGAAVLPVVLLLRAAGGTARRRLLVAATAALVVAVLGMAGLWLVRGNERTVEAVAPRLEQVERSLDFRVEAWRNSLAIIEDNPWTGIGPHTFLTALPFSPDSRFFHEEKPPHPHNVFLYVTQSGGAPALVLFVTWLALLLGALWKTAMQKDDGPLGTLSAALFAAAVALVVGNLFDLGLALLTVAPAPLFVLSGLLAAPRDDEPPPLRLLPGPATILAVLLLVLLWQLAIQPLRARTRLQQAQVFTLDASQRDDDPRLRERARESMRLALQLDPTTPRAHELLARWLEKEPDGVDLAGDVLLDLLRLAPGYAPTHSLLGDLHVRAGSFERAAGEYSAAIAAGQNSVHQVRDRANLIICLVNTGRADEAMNQLVAALEMNMSVIDRLQWQHDPSGALVLPVTGSNGARSISLLDAVETVYRRRQHFREAGGAVGRRFWMDSYKMFRKAGRDDRAMEVLEYLERFVPSVEPHIVWSERAAIARDAGDRDGARRLFEKAYEISEIPFYRSEAQRLAAAPDETDGETDGEPPAPEEADAVVAVELSGDVVQYGAALKKMLDTESKQLEADGEFAAAADRLQRTLMYFEDPLERARLRLRIAALQHGAGDFDAERDTLAAALGELSAKPFPLRDLKEGLVGSLPERVAAAFDAALAAKGLDIVDRQRAAWRLPDYYGSSMGPSLFRLGFYQTTGQVDRLEREADLLLLEDPDNTAALWARLTALEGFGRAAEADMAMRNLAEHAATSFDVETVWKNFTYANIRRQHDPAAWRDGGVLQLLRGYYKEAADLFGTSAELYAKEGDVERQADALSWQARALALCGRIDAARDALDRALALKGTDPLLLLRRRALG